MELAGHPPLGATNQAGITPPLVEAGRPAMSFEVSGINHQDLWPWGIGCRQLGKDQIKNTGNYIPRETLENPDSSQ